MREIILTQGKVALVDDENFERLNQFKWCAAKIGKMFYAQRSIPKINGKQATIVMHREIMGKPPKGFEIDHENGNGLWNLKNNLRFVTNRQNCQNKRNGKNKSSQFPGVSWKKKNKKWQAYITINGINKYLGYFTDECEAFEAYKQAINDIGETVINN